MSEEQKNCEENIAYLKQTVYVDKNWTDVEELQQPLIEILIKNGKKQPTFIQYKALDTIFSKVCRYIGIKAPNGCGKTLTFVLPTLQIALLNKEKSVSRTEEYVKDQKTIQEKLYSPFVIIVLDTIILLQQIKKEIEDLAPEGIIVEALHKESSIQCAGQILLSTPDLLQKYIFEDKQILTENLQYFVIDEADTVFKNFPLQINSLINKIKTINNAQIQIVSATLNKETLDLFKNVVKIDENQDDDDYDEEEIHIIGIDTTLEGVKQFYIDEENDQESDEKAQNKFIIVEKIINTILTKTTESGQIIQTQIIVFFNQIHKLQSFLNYYKQKETPLKYDYITSDKNVADREKVMLEFRKGNYDLLFATNIIARGIDIRSVGLVINLDCPIKQGKLITQELEKQVDYETYLHRVGRTGRYHDLGVAITLIDKSTKNIIDKVKEKFDQNIEKYDEKIVIQELQKVIENNNKDVLKK